MFKTLLDRKSCLVFAPLLFGGDSLFERQLTLEYIVANWKRFMLTKERLTRLIRDRNLADVNTFMTTTFGCYLNSIQQQYVAKEFDIVQRIILEQENLEQNSDLVHKYQNTILNDIIVMDYLVKGDLR